MNSPINSKDTTNLTKEVTPQKPPEIKNEERQRASSMPASNILQTMKPELFLPNFQQRPRRKSKFDDLLESKMYVDGEDF